MGSELERARELRKAYDEAVVQEGRELAGPFMTVSGAPIERLYDATDVADIDYERDINLPGSYPFTRGVHRTGYRGKPWTIRMFSGFGSVEETNQRYKDLLAAGNNGLSVAFDMPTLMGYDHDDPWAEGEFGSCGVAVDSLSDMDILLSDLPLDRITTSMTINSPAPVIWALFIAAAEKRGVPRAKLAGTLQNDILKEYIAQNEYIYSPEHSMRLVTDTIEFASKEMPLWNPVSVSGYHIREAGSTAAQELAFTLADGIEYVKWGLARGLDIDSFAGRISFFFNSHNDFFEEVAKFRAARRIWARQMRERFGAKTRTLVAHALPHPDRRRLAHRAAARGEPRPRRHPGARRRAWAAPSPSTPTPWTKRWRSPATRPPASPSAPSRSSSTRAASSIPSTPSAAPTSSSASPPTWRRRSSATSSRSKRSAASSLRSRPASSRRRSPTPPPASSARSTPATASSSA